MIRNYFIIYNLVSNYLFTYLFINNIQWLKHLKFIKKNIIFNLQIFFL